MGFWGLGLLGLLGFRVLGLVSSRPQGFLGFRVQGSLLVGFGGLGAVRVESLVLLGLRV